MVIWFNSEKARSQLINHNEVITCRKRRKTFGITSAIYKNEDGNSVVIDKVHVMLLDESIDEQREHIEAFTRHLALSGFETVEEWIKEVKKLNNNRWMPQYLMFIKVTSMSWYNV